MTNNVDVDEPKEKKKKDKWEAVAQEDYAKAAELLIHFNAKTVNANAKNTGIRLPVTHSHSLPYASSGAVPVREIPLSCANPLKLVPAVKQLSAAYSAEKSGDSYYHAEPLAAIAEVFPYFSQLEQGKQMGADRVCNRLRQVYFPVAEEEYVLLTPLHSAGFSAYLKNTAFNANVFLRKGLWPIGGKQSQNCDIRAYDMTRPFVFELPRPDKAIRQMLAVKFKGVSLTASSALLRKYGQWLKSQKGVLSTNASRYAEEQHMVSIVRELEDRIHAARDMLSNYEGELVLDPLQERILQGGGLLSEEDVKAISSKILMSFDTEPSTRAIPDESRKILDKFINRELRKIVL